MARQPTGTVTYLFTDIEGSTKLWERYPEAMETAVARHDALVREAIAAQDGYVVKATGDGFHAAFAAASNALAAALAAQRALHAEAWGEVPIRVRMGLHSGAAEERAGDYFGTALNRAARLMAAGHGGQILLSRATYELVCDQLPDQVGLRDLGKQRLKDLSRPEHVFQVVAPDVPAGFPPLRTLDYHPNNLPVQTTSFIGREKEMAEIERLLSPLSPEERVGEGPGVGARLLTLVGPGGIGKTRLALEAAAAQLDHYAHGVFFVPLASVPSPDYLVPTVADALQFNFDTKASDLDPKNQLLDYLSTRDVLLVMDNFEHLVEGAALLADMLERAPETRLLVTSRERLHLQGEWTFDVQGMRYPDNGDGDGDGTDGHGALKLFLERARQVDSRFALSADERPYVSRICRLVEGMPLGIELAAAWVTMLSCRDIAEEIEKNIDFLVTSMRDVPDKHRSLRAAFDHSWKLLTEAQRESFRKLSVFRSGFSRQAAMAVAEANLLLLSDLVSKSLLRSAEGRYQVHELLRQYAEEKLEHLPEEKDGVHDRHSRYYVEYLSVRRPDLGGDTPREIADEVRAEMDNIRAAIRWAVMHWEEEEARDALVSLFAFYIVQGWHEGRQAFQSIARVAKEARRAARMPGAPVDPVYLSARVHEALFNSQLGDTEVSEAISLECLPSLRQLGMRRELAHCLWCLGANAAVRGEYDKSRQCLEEAITLGTQIQAASLVPNSLLWLGWVFHQQGDYEQAMARFQECYRLFNQRGNRWGLAFALSKLGLVADARKDYAQARQYHQEGREMSARLGDRAGEAYATSRLSASAYSMGEYAEAKQVGHAGYEIFKEIGHRWGITASLCRIGFAEIGLGNSREAMRRFYDALERAMKMEYVPLALYALAGIASVLAVEGKASRAVELLAVLQEHPRMPALYLDIAERWFSDIETKLSPDVLAAARERGSGSDLETVVEAVLGDQAATGADCY
jgi:predicted ATPase/class 3 adenylate cyclase